MLIRPSRIQSNNMKQLMNSKASSWVNIDGGKAALDMLEKMVEVTMMRGKLIPIAHIAIVVNI